MQSGEPPDGPITPAGGTAGLSTGKCFRERGPTSLVLAAPRPWLGMGGALFLQVNLGGLHGASW